MRPPRGAGSTYDASVLPVPGACLSTGNTALSQNREMPHACGSEGKNCHRPKRAFIQSVHGFLQSRKMRLSFLPVNEGPVQEPDPEKDQEYRHEVRPEFPWCPDDADTDNDQKCPDNGKEPAGPGRGPVRPFLSCRTRPLPCKYSRTDEPKAKPDQHAGSRVTGEQPDAE